MKGLTKHGNKRVRQRIKSKDVEKVASIAFEKGLRQKDAKGRLAKYLAAQSRKYLTDPVIYNENVFVYSKSKSLVTTFPLPFRFRGSANSQQKRQDEQHTASSESNDSSTDPGDASESDE